LQPPNAGSLLESIKLIYTSLMITLPPFAEMLGSDLSLTQTTMLRLAKKLRAGKLFSRGRQGPGSVPLTSRDAVSLLLVGVLDHRYGTDFAADVRHVRSLPVDKLIERPRGFTKPLTFARAATAGEALDAIIDDMRIGRWAMWCAGKACDLCVALDASGKSVTFTLSAPKRTKTDSGNAILTFNGPDFAKRPKAVERQVSIPGEVLLRLATALGPPEKEPSYG
jgi:hypothetical protein